MSEATRAENVAPKPYDLEAHYQELEQKITAAGIPADLGRVRAAFESKRLTASARSTA